MILLQAKEEFLRAQHLRGNSEDTYKYYDEVLSRFVRFWGEDFPVEFLGVEYFNDYKLLLMDMPQLSNISINTYLRAVKVFFQWLADNGYIEDVTEKLVMLKQEKRQIVPLSDAELEKLLSVFDDTLLGWRNKCIVMLMLDCGLRRSEVVRLQMSDVDYVNRCMLVNGKGNKQRLVPFGIAVYDCLMSYLDLRSRVPGSLFMGVYDSGITIDTVKMLFQNLKVKTGIRRLHAHLLRHTFATRFMMAGGDLESLRILLGHSSITITQVYLHLATVQHILQGRFISLVDKVVGM